ncbi:MAG: hypothetical protein MJ200_01250 [Mycoplasmoidaceae bacterium]|nr:hypothetical protein [Mycoplasmoidaceae bacterium]
MKRIGILYDKDSKKVFLLPKDVKQLTQQGIAVSVPVGLARHLGINDNEYVQAGATICPQ